MSETFREECAAVLEVVAHDGLRHPRDLDAALDAIECSLGIPINILAQLRAGTHCVVPVRCEYLPDSKPYRVVLLASYCGDDDPTCTDDLPCLECLKMSNIFRLKDGFKNGGGSWGYQRDQLAAAQETPRDE